MITVSSGGMYTQRLDPASLQMPRSRYRGATAYAKAKRAQVALSREWARRLAGTGVAFHAMHPGWVNTPGVATALPGFYRATGPILLTPEQGADTIVWLATMPPERLGSGRFGTTGARGRKTRCRGRASQTPAPHASCGTTWTRRPPQAHRSWRRQGWIARLLTMTSLRRGRDDRAAAV